MKAKKPIHKSKSNKLNQKNCKNNQIKQKKKQINYKSQIKN